MAGNYRNNSERANSPLPSTQGHKSESNPSGGYKEKGTEGYGGHFNEEKDVTIGGPMGKSG